MIDPIIPAIEVWLAIWNNLPPSLLALVNFCLGLFLVLALFRLIYHIRS